MKPPKNNYCRRPFWWWGSLYNNFSHFETKKKILCTQFQKCFLSFFFSYWESTVCVCVCVLVYEWCAHIKKNLKFNSHFGCILGANLIQRKKTVKILLLKPSKQTNNQKKKRPFTATFDSALFIMKRGKHSKFNVFGTLF